MLITCYWVLVYKNSPIFGKNHYMRNILLLCLLPLFTHAQEPVWTKCVYEKEYAYVRDNKAKKMKDGISFCYNRYAFAFGDKVNKQVMQIDGYSQDTSINGYLTEAFYNKKDAINDWGDYTITIVHSNPAWVCISNDKVKCSYTIKTTSIPMVKVSRHE